MSPVTTPLESRDIFSPASPSQSPWELTCPGSERSRSSPDTHTPTQEQTAPPRSHACGSAPGTGETETREVLNIGTRVQTGFLDASPRQGSLGQCQRGEVLPHSSRQRVLGFIPGVSQASYRRVLERQLKESRAGSTMKEPVLADRAGRSEFAVTLYVLSPLRRHLSSPYYNHRG